MTATEPTSPTPAAPDQNSVNPERLEALLGQVIADLGGALTVPLALVGDRLGLWKALAASGPATAEQLAGQAGGLAERYVREWLRAMAAAGYVTHVADGPGAEQPDTARYRLSPEQIEAFTNPDSPAYVAGAFQNLSAATRVLDRLTEAFRTGSGIGWHEHHSDMFTGTERFFRPGYLAHLTQEWIPALDGVAARLKQGARVADVGCGLGASTIIMATAFPASEFLGVDYHRPSIELAKSRVAEAGGLPNVAFQVAGAEQLSGRFDLITFFDCLHDMPDPVGALSAARNALAGGNGNEAAGTVMLVEPMSWDRLSDSLNPLGRVFAGASVLVCLPSGLSGPPAAGLGNQAGPEGTRRVAEQAGFTRFREAATTPFNRIYELRP